MGRRLFKTTTTTDRRNAEKAVRAAMEREAAEAALERLTENESSLDPAFDALAGLSGEELARLLADADMDMLAIALKGSSGAVLKRVRETASEELWERILDKVAFFGPVRRADAIAAQQAILSAWKTPGDGQEGGFQG